MNGDGQYLTTYECALAVVATSMKKARLLLDTLIINSFIGGILFTSGGMLHVMIQAESPELYQSNPGIVHLIQGVLYPIGLFYVVIMGVDLFNSNILFFAVGVARGAVSILDLIISWLVSWWLNLAGNIFVCYIICHYSSVTSLASWVAGSIAVLDQKLESNFGQTLIKGIAGNFFVCLAIYLQLMAKPLHVKFLMMMLPIFTFVSLGFTHSVADMFMIVIALVNGAPTSVATVAWKLFLPGALGNIIGGSFFALVIPWYLHIVVVERDQKKLHLPRYDMRDQQPEINQDSRVVRAQEDEEEEETEGESGLDEVIEKAENDENQSIAQSFRTASVISRRNLPLKRSPSNVFPVYGMGRPGERERSIASGAGFDRNATNLQDIDSKENRKSATFMGETLLRTLSRTQSKRDLEANDHVTQATRNRYPENTTLQNRNVQPRAKLRRANTALSGVPPDVIVENSNSETSNSPRDSSLEVQTYDPADRV